MSNELQTVEADGALIIRFSRPNLRNPLSGDVITRLHEIVDRLENDDGTDALIFTGEGNVFASGADLREIVEIKSSQAVEFSLHGQSLMGKVQALPQMTIAAINGFCFGGALDLALACDHRLASPNASFAHPGAGLGIITGWGGTQRLPRLIGQGRALEMFFTAEAVDAGTAHTYGLIDGIDADPLAAAITMAHTESVRGGDSGDNIY